MVGTPSFVAPEAYCFGALDQRTDLFALGALGYWLCTGAHAFASQSFRELEQLHAQPPPAPSRLFAASALHAAEPIPQALDDLLLALLKPDPHDRPQHIEELIDRLHALTDIEPEESRAFARGYIESKAFVGRASERRAFSHLLTDAHGGGRVKAVCIEAEPGLGRSRLLHELALASRVSGVITLEVATHPGAPEFTFAASLILALLDSLPTALERVRQYAAELARTSEALARRLGLPGGRPDQAAALEAYRQLLLEIGREHALGVFVDDLQKLDQPSQALLASLVLEKSPAKLLVVVTLPSGLGGEPSPALRSVRQAALPMELCALTASEVHSLLRSVFGRVPYLDRLAQRVHQASAGNPAHCLEIAEYLARSGAALYSEGSWSLPADLDPTSLPTRREAQIARLTQLSETTRAFARELSLPHWGALTIEHCSVLCERNEESVRASLDELCKTKVLSEVANGYAFVSEDLRKELHRELEPQLATQLHARLGHWIEQNGRDNPHFNTLAALHLLHAGQLEPGLELMKRASAPFLARDLSAEIRDLIPMFEAGYVQLKKLGANDHALAATVSMLALAGYLVNWRYGARYGDEALEVNARVLRLDLYQRWRGMIGARLALVGALVWGYVSARAQYRYAANIPFSVTLYIGVASSLNAMASTLGDLPAARRYAEAIEPFSAFGRNHVAGFTYEFASFVARQAGDRIGANYAELLRLRQRLLSKPRLRGLVPALEHALLAGLDSLRSLMGNWCEATDNLEAADGIGRLPPLQQLYAAESRMHHYMRRGDLALYELHRARVEFLAVQLDSAWQIECWGGTGEAMNTAIQTNDAVRMKRAAQHLARICEALPSLNYLLRRARGYYCVLRGKFARAIALLDADEEPLAHCGWAQARGMLARAHNALGEHQRAKEICVEALSHLTSADLEFVVWNLGLQIELAMAESGLGNHVEAARQLDELITTHTPLRGPFTLGALHHARARASLSAADMELCREHVAKMDAYYRPIGLSTLRALVENLERQLGVSNTNAVVQPQERAQQLASRLIQCLRRPPEGQSLIERGQVCLRIAMEVVEASAGFILLREDDSQPLVHIGPTVPSRELLAWARERLSSDEDDEATSVASLDAGIALHTWVSDSVQYRFSTLVLRTRGAVQVTGGLVLGSENSAPSPPPVRLLQAIAQYIERRETHGGP
jgi:hypothetical protein